MALVDETEEMKILEITAGYRSGHSTITNMTWQLEQPREQLNINEPSSALLPWTSMPYRAHLAIFMMNPEALSTKPPCALCGIPDIPLIVTRYDHDHAVAAVQARASRKSSPDFTVAISTRERKKPALLDDRKYAQGSEQYRGRDGKQMHSTSREAQETDHGQTIERQECFHSSSTIDWYHVMPKLHHRVMIQISDPIPIP